LREKKYMEELKKTISERRLFKQGKCEVYLKSGSFASHAVDKD